MAAAHLFDTGARFPAREARRLRAKWRTITQMLERCLLAPPTSSAGRLFDAVASLAGLADRVSYEGQADIQLEWLATRQGPAGAYSFHLDAAGEWPLVIDTCPMARTVGPDTVVLSGGVFLNALLTSEVSTRLLDDAIRVSRHCLVPPCDGGLSLGQLAIVAAVLEGGIDVPRNPRAGGGDVPRA